MINSRCFLALLNFFELFFDIFELSNFAFVLDGKPPHFFVDIGNLVFNLLFFFEQQKLFFFLV